MHHVIAQRYVNMDTSQLSAVLAPTGVFESPPTPINQYDVLVLEYSLSSIFNSVIQIVTPGGNNLTVSNTRVLD